MTILTCKNCDSLAEVCLCRKCLAETIQRSGVQTVELPRRERAEMIWAIIKSYMLDECSLECASVGPSDEKYIINEIFNSIPASTVSSAMPRTSDWTPEQFWEYAEGLTDAHTRDQLRSTMQKRGLSLVSSTNLLREDK